MAGGKVYIPISAYPEHEVRELRDILDHHRIELVEVDPYALGGPGTVEVSEIYQRLSQAYGQIFGGYKIFGFIGGYVIKKAALDPLWAWLRWQASKWRPEFEKLPLEIDLGEQIKIKVRITLDGKPDEEFNRRLETFLEEGAEKKLLEGNNNDLIIYCRWNPKDGAIVKGNALQIEGLDKMRDRLKEALDASKKSQKL